MIAIFDLKRAMEEVLSLAYFANEYVEAQKPWVLVKEDKDQLASVMYSLLEMIRHLGLMLLPYTPIVAEKILNYLHIDMPTYHQNSGKFNYESAKKWGGLKPGQLLEKAEPLFPRI